MHDGTPGLPGCLSSPSPAKLTARSCCGGSEEDRGPHRPLPGEALLHAQDGDDVASSAGAGTGAGAGASGPPLGLVARSEEVEMAAERAPDGLDGGHPLATRVYEDERDHRAGRADLLQALRADSYLNRLDTRRCRRLDGSGLLQNGGQIQ